MIRGFEVLAYRRFRISKKNFVAILYHVSKCLAAISSHEFIFCVCFCKDFFARGCGLAAFCCVEYEPSGWTRVHGQRTTVWPSGRSSVKCQVALPSVVMGTLFGACVHEEKWSKQGWEAQPGREPVIIRAVESLRHYNIVDPGSACVDYTCQTCSCWVYGV